MGKKQQAPKYTGPTPEQIAAQSQQYDALLSSLNQQNEGMRQQYESIFNQTSQDYNTRLSTMQQQSDAQRQYFEQLAAQQNAALQAQTETNQRLTEEQNRALEMQRAQTDKATAMGNREQTEMMRLAQQRRGSGRLQRRNRIFS
jgi:hypothetical protein